MYEYQSAVGPRPDFVRAAIAKKNVASINYSLSARSSGQSGYRHNRWVGPYADHFEVQSVVAQPLALVADSGAQPRFASGDDPTVSRSYRLELHEIQGDLD